MPRAVVISPGLNLRAGPGMHHPATHVLGKGDELFVSEPCARWARVRVLKTKPAECVGMTGYVYSRHISLLPERDRMPETEPFPWYGIIAVTAGFVAICVGAWHLMMRALNG